MLHVHHSTSNLVGVLLDSRTSLHHATKAHAKPWVSVPLLLARRFCQSDMAGISSGVLSMVQVMVNSGGLSILCPIEAAMWPAAAAVEHVLCRCF